jgi:AraC-like DNA-binding protein
LLLLRDGEEFTFQMPGGTDLVSIAIERSAFDRVLASAPQPDAIDRLLKQPVLKLPMARLSDARRRMLALLDLACVGCDSTESAELEQRIEASLAAQVVALLADPELDKHQTPVSSPSSFVVDKSHRLAVADGRNPLKVVDICRKLRVSRRTVQNDFQAVVHTTPLNYLRCLRLNHVRRALLETSAEELSIGDAAARWGFSHLSHFAANYRALFGELPSKTPRAAFRQVPMGSTSVVPDAGVTRGRAPGQATC